MSQMLLPGPCACNKTLCNLQLMHQQVRDVKGPMYQQVDCVKTPIGDGSELCICRTNCAVLISQQVY